MSVSVLTVTLNPAVDETVFVEGFRPGAVHRARALTRQAGGKGVNVAMMLAAAGLDVAATGFLGKDNAALFERAMRERQVGDRFVRVAGETRTSIKIVDEASRTTTDINLPGLSPSGPEMESLREIVAATTAEPLGGQRSPNEGRGGGKAFRSGMWVVLSGSLPPGVSPADFAALIALARRGGAHVAVDTSGPALEAAVEEGVDLIKPNASELSQLAGRPFESVDDIWACAEQVHEKGVAHVIVSLGSEGALFLTPEQRLMATAPPVEVVSTVGAGDSMLAGYLAALLQGKTAAERARDATVFAWCALASPERELVDPLEREARGRRITVQPLPERA